RLWQGEFGDASVDRNSAAGEVRESFWQALLAEYPVRNVLEVGCNLGANLQWVAKSVPANHVYGIDVNQKALEELNARKLGVNTVWGQARELPFRDRWF